MTGNVRNLVKIFKVMLAFFLFGLLVATAQATDLCCSDVQKSLKDLKSEVASLKELNVVVKDLSAKLDKQFNWSSSPNVACPCGFTYLPSAKRCYQVVYESHNWTSAAKKCRDLNRGSRLVAISSEAENSALKTFLASEFSKNPDSRTACIPSEWNSPENYLLWTSGQRQIQDDCESPFEWKLSSEETLPVEFTDWLSGEPKCKLDAEFCIEMEVQKNFKWNDRKCNEKICPLCEYKP